MPTSLGAGAVFRQQVRSIDLAPTILESLGSPLPEEVEGRSLLPLLRGESDRGARLARSYSTGGDYGLVLRTDEGFKYTVRNGFRGDAAQARRELWRIDGRGRQEKIELEGAPRAESFRRVARRTLEQMSGLSIEVTACSRATVLRLMPPVKALDLFASRSVDLPPGAWRRWSLRGLEAEIPEAGGSLKLEQLPEPALHLTLHDDQDLIFEKTLDLPTGQQDPGAPWRPSSKDVVSQKITSLDGCSLQVTWRSKRGESIDVETSFDREVERQLKALGYLMGR